MQLIKEKATGVEITVEFPRIVLKGPQIKVNRVADTVGALVSGWWGWDDDDSDGSLSNLRSPRLEGKSKDPSISCVQALNWRARWQSGRNTLAMSLMYLWRRIWCVFPLHLWSSTRTQRLRWIKSEMAYCIFLDLSPLSINLNPLSATTTSSWVARKEKQASISSLHSHLV